MMPNKDYTNRFGTVLLILVVISWILSFIGFWGMIIALFATLFKISMVISASTLGTWSFISFIVGICFFAISSLSLKNIANGL